MINFLTLKESINFFFILTSIILLGIVIFFNFNIKKLKIQITKLQEERKEILERKILKGDNSDLVSIQTISTEKKEFSSARKSSKLPSKEGKPITKQKLEYVASTPKKNSSSNKTTPKSSIDKEINSNRQVTVNQTPKNKSVKKSLPEESVKSSCQNITEFSQKNNNSSTKKTYQKNILQNYSKVTSPVTISNPKNFDVNEFVKKNEKVVPKIQKEKAHPDYLKEISKKMEDSLSSQVIELTDYEKEQEAHAIISYQELLSTKDKIMLQNEKEETIDFIEELKNFRNNLN